MAIMAKAKRGKSSASAASELVRWEIELMKTPLNQNDWKAMVYLLEPKNFLDKPVISLISDAINSGLRKLFSVVNYDFLINELISHKNNKGKLATKSLPFSEIYDEAKSVFDQGGCISTELLAKLVKFKLLSIKRRDLDRRQEEKKLANSESKHKSEKLLRKPSASPGRKSQSGGKLNKKNAKKDDKLLSPKKDTKLKRRDELYDVLDTIDDEPDGDNDPMHYIIITGFPDPSLLSYFSEMQIQIHGVVKLSCSDRELAVPQNDISSHGDCNVQTNMEGITMTEADKRLQNVLDVYWKDCELILNNVSPVHLLKDVAQFDLMIAQEFLPQTSLSTLDSEEKSELSKGLLDQLAFFCYDTVDSYKEYQSYLNNLKVINLSQQSEEEQSEESGTSINIANGIGVLKPTEVDKRYYNHLLRGIPVENQSVPYILHCLLEQVTMNTDNSNPMSEVTQEKESTLEALIEEFFDNQTAMYDVSKMNKKTVNMYQEEQKIPIVVYDGDAITMRQLRLPSTCVKQISEAEHAVLQRHPYRKLSMLVKPASSEWIENSVQRQSLYSLCKDEAFLTEEQFDDVIIQHVFESLTLPETDSFEDQVERVSDYWENLCSTFLQTMESKRDGKHSISKMDHYLWREKFRPEVLWQIIDKASILRPYLKTCYNRVNNTLSVALHNPGNCELHNSTKWTAQVHSDVGFRNYLEYVAVTIADWTREQNRLREEEHDKVQTQEHAVSSCITSPIKEKSRLQLKTRSELEKETIEIDKHDKSRKKSAKGSSSRQIRSKTPDKKRSESKLGSAKKSRLDNPSKIPIGKLNEDLGRPENIEKEMSFNGYNLGDSCFLVSGELSYLFPADKSQIKVQKRSHVQGNTSVQISVTKNDHVFSIYFVNPIKAVEEEPQTKSTVNPSELEKQDIPVITMDLSGEEKNSRTTISPVSNTNVNDLPPLTQVPEARRSYSGICATLSDGMLLAYSTWLARESQSQKPIENELVSNEINEAKSQIVVAQSPKSPKGKRSKKDGEARLQEEAEKLRKESLLAKEILLQRELVKDRLKEQESIKNLYVTTPDGQHIAFQHSLVFYDVENSEESKENFMIKLQNIGLTDQEDDKTTTELYRCVTEEGSVIKYMFDDTVEVLTAGGNIYRSSAFVSSKSPASWDDAANISVESEQLLSSAKRLRKETQQESLKSDETTITETVNLLEPGLRKSCIDWSMISVNGERKIFKVDGSEQHQGNLLISSAKCCKTDEVMETREDGVITVRYSDGKMVVEFLDGTRISTAYQSESSENDESLGDCKTKVITVEHESYSPVVVNFSENSFKVLFSNDKEICGYKNGGYIVSKSNFKELAIDRNGALSISPKHAITVSENSVLFPEKESLPVNSCIVKESLIECLNFYDIDCNRFLINAAGDFEVIQNKNMIGHGGVSPRYFIVYPDGSGEELLKDAEVSAYISDMKQNVSSTVVSCDDNGESSWLIMKPLSYSERSKIGKSSKSLTPCTLTERNFKTFPAEIFSGEDADIETQAESYQPPTVLQVRKLVKRFELSNQVWNQVEAGVRKYSDLVQRLTLESENTIPRDVRSEQEKLDAEDLYEQNAHIYSKISGDDIKKLSDDEIINHFVKSKKPRSSSLKVMSKPKRAKHEWEKDKIELAELKYAKSVLRKREFPPYFDTEEGQEFLRNNSIDLNVPAMEVFTSKLAYETVHPPQRSPSTEENSTVSPECFSVESNERSTPLGVTYENSPSLHMSSSLSVKCETSRSTISPYVSSNDARPLNPTPKQASNNVVDPTFGFEPHEAIKLETIPEYAGDRTEAISCEFPSCLGAKSKNAPVNELSVVERSIRQNIKSTSSPPDSRDISTKLHGFVLLPNLVDFGILREGLTYSYRVEMKNIGIDSCRFKIQQPPPSTGLKVNYKPGLVAAGMSTLLEIEIFALAAGVEGGSNGIGQISHFLQITTETDVLNLPILATIVTQEEYDNPSDLTPYGGPSKGTLIIGDKPPLRESLTRRRKLSK